MANQSQRRVDRAKEQSSQRTVEEIFREGQQFKEQLAAKKIEAFTYSPLDPTIDCIRLLLVEPTLYQNDPIRCTLHHFTFAQKPKYEAVSYTWGDETNKKPIGINGRSFYVGKNIEAALRQVRLSYLRGGERAIWIDAICINQSNIQERSSQLRIMPYIYQKAQGVLISLATPDVGSFDVGFVGIPSLERICRNDYWKRLWIIQEVLLARRLTIYYHNDTASWDTFINSLVGPTFADCIPLKLQRQREEKYTDGHKLQSLVEHHFDALCKEPRDKIYGLIGLANDCIEGYPQDYNKSLYEVWRDALICKGKDQDGPQHDIMKYGRLVKSVLNIPVFDVPVVTNTSSIKVPTYLVGSILKIGPTSTEVISNLKKVSEWRATIERCVPSGRRAVAREESAYFLEMLEEMVQEDFAPVSTQGCGYEWKPKKAFSPLHGRDSSVVHPLFDTPCDTEHSLFLLLPPVGNECPCACMGLVPASAKEGDMICMVQGIKRALIVRSLAVYDDLGRDQEIVEKLVLVLVGTAAMADSSRTIRGLRASSVPSRKETGFIEATFKSIPFEQRLEIPLPVSLVYNLLD